MGAIRKGLKGIKLFDVEMIRAYLKWVKIWEINKSVDGLIASFARLDKNFAEDTGALSYHFLQRTNEILRDGTKLPMRPPVRSTKCLGELKSYFDYSFELQAAVDCEFLNICIKEYFDSPEMVDTGSLDNDAEGLHLHFYDRYYAMYDSEGDYDEFTCFVKFCIEMKAGCSLAEIKKDIIKHEVGLSFADDNDDDFDDTPIEFKDDNRDLYYEDTAEAKELEAAFEDLGDTSGNAVSPVEEKSEPEVEGITWFNKRELQSVGGNSNDRAHGAYIAKLVRGGVDVKPYLKISDESVFDVLREEFLNFSEVISFYKAQFRLMEMTGRNRINPVLLMGPPGVGKTMFCKRLAQALQTGFTYVDMSTASSAWVLTGMHATWNGSKVGKVFDAMYYSPTASPILLLDELEKPVSPEKDPKNALYQLLEESSSSMFVDEFIDCPVNLSTVIYLACANSLEGMPEPLLTRFKIFDIAPPSDGEQEAIIQNIYKAETNGFEGFAKTLTLDVLGGLKNQPLRVVKQMIGDAIGSVLLEKTPEELQALKKEMPQSLAVEMRHLKLAKENGKTAKIGF